MHFTVFALEK